MTDNKAQGQSLQQGELNLINPFFSHGQLYVESSRVLKLSNLFVFAKLQVDNYCEIKEILKNMFNNMYKLIKGT